MRFSVFSTILLACASLSACASSTPDVALSVKPSKETTGSVTGDAPVPAVAVGQAAADDGKPDELAWAGQVPGSHAFDGIASDGDVVVPLE